MTENISECHDDFIQKAIFRFYSPFMTTTWQFAEFYANFMSFKREFFMWIFTVKSHNLAIFQSR